MSEERLKALSALSAKQFAERFVEGDWAIVTYCKDCKYFEPVAAVSQISGETYFSYWGHCRLYPNYAFVETHFCSQAERKETE